MKKINMKTGYIQSKHKQQGAVLFISLMILLVLTLLGVSSLNGSLMEEKMAANAQTSTTIFQSAESAIRTTYYTESENDSSRSLAVTKAENNTSITLAATGGTTRSARLVYPENTTATPLYNNSAGLFVAHGIEIVGTASMRNIQETNAQGYSIYPMRAPNK